MVRTLDATHVFTHALRLAAYAQGVNSSHFVPFHPISSHFVPFRRRQGPGTEEAELGSRGVARAEAEAEEKDNDFVT